MPMLVEIWKKPIVPANPIAAATGLVPAERGRRG
jgi:hypothetical protein